jgi:hypothetical protein
MIGAVGLFSNISHSSPQPVENPSKSVENPRKDVEKFPDLLNFA